MAKKKAKSNNDVGIEVQLTDGKWYLDKFALHECCDCGLMHSVQYAVENGRIFVCWKLLPRETAAVRRKLGIKVTRARNPSK